MGSGKRRVWIHYEPLLYQELFISIIRSFGVVDVIDDYLPDALYTSEGDERLDDVDVIVLSLADCSQQAWVDFALRIPNAKVVAFSPKGDRGLIYLPGENRLVEIRPFGLAQLVDEVIFGNI